MSDEKDREAPENTEDQGTDTAREGEESEDSKDAGEAAGAREQAGEAGSEDEKETESGGAKKTSEKKSTRKSGGGGDDGDDGTIGLGGKMTFIEHLEELRYRIIVCALTFLVCFIVIYSTSVQTLKYWLTLPLTDVLKEQGSSLIFTGMAEGFIFELKISAIGAIFVASPMIFYQIWAFVAPGLYKKERIYAGPFILFSTFFFAAGAAFFYFIVFPVAADFFSSFAAAGEIEWKPKLSEVFTFIMMMMLAFGIVFQLPVVAFILAKLNIISVAFLNKNRKYALLIMVVLAAFFTPPDVVSQALLAGPMWLLYELSVLITWVFGSKKPKEADEE